MAFLKNISTSTATDAELVKRYKKTNDQKLVGELYQRYMDLVYGVCLKYLKQPENAQDSVILIFEELITKLHKYEVDHFRAWLFTLAKNHCLMRLRSEKKHKTVPFEPEFMQSGENGHLIEHTEKEMDFQNMEFCMEQLHPDQKKVIELFYLEGKCYNDITAQTGLDWNQVRSFIQNGKRNLKICMENKKENSVQQNGYIK